MQRQKWTSERILLEIRRLHARGERLSVRRLRDLGLGGMVTTAYKFFGDWRSALQAAEVEAPPASHSKWSRERILLDIRRLAREGHQLSFSAARRLCPPLVQAALRHPDFGSWGAALAAAGLEPAEHEQRRHWSRESILAALRELRTAPGGLSPTSVRSAHPDLFAAAISPRYFGSWAAAVRSAGLEYQERVRHHWTRESVLKAIKQIHAQGGRLTVSWLRTHGWGSLVAAARKPSMYGTWRDAVESAGLDYDAVRRNDNQQDR